MPWLINSMELEIGQVHLFLPTAKAIQDAMATTYSNCGNSTQVLALKTHLQDRRQGDQDVTCYFNQLKALWQEIDQYLAINWACPDDNANYQCMIEKDRVYFLIGLRYKFDEACEHVLRREPLQPILDVFAYIRRAKS